MKKRPSVFLAPRLTLAVLLLAGSTDLSLGAEFEPLFDGKTLEGWTTVGDALWTVADGAITGRSGPEAKRNCWLVTKKTYGDFVLELEVKADSGNSGVQLRSHLDAQQVMRGYQIEVDTRPRAWSGGLYDEGRRGWLQNLEHNEAGRRAFKVGGWNQYRIECRGDHIKSWVNEVPITDYVDCMDIEGIIALQVHSGKDCVVAFRHIRLQDLGRRAWQPLWDGRTFTGWHPIGQGVWKIVDGVIDGSNVKEQSEFGHLVTDALYKDFTVRLRYKAFAGNSGLYFRIEEQGFSGVSGFQAEIDATRDAGGLYETNGRAWVVQPKPEDVQKHFRPQDWNTMSVSAHGRRLVVHVNGWKSAELPDDPGRLEGKLALQVHGSQDVHVQFKDIEVLSDPR
jgi:hypothetical protein